MPINAREWVTIASGFSRILWSIPAGLFFFTGVLEVAWARYFHLPSYVLAAGLYYWGLAALHRLPAITPVFNRLVRSGILFAFLLVYFAPFVYWWRLQPTGDHFVVNVFALFMAITCILWNVNRLAEEVAKCLEDRVFQIEARLCGWSVIALMGAPMAVYFAYGTIRARLLDVPLYVFIENLRFMPLAHWIFAGFLLPLTLTLAISWKTQRRALQCVTHPTCTGPALPG